MARKGRRGSQSGKLADAFVKAFLAGRKAINDERRAERDDKMSDIRMKYYEALTKKAEAAAKKSEASTKSGGGISDAEFEARLRGKPAAAPAPKADAAPAPKAEEAAPAPKADAAPAPAAPAPAAETPKEAEPAVPAEPKGIQPYPTWMQRAPAWRSGELESEQPTKLTSLEGAVPVDDYGTMTQPNNVAMNDVPQEDALGLTENAMSDYVLNAAEGGMMDEPTSEVSAEEAIGAALRGVQNMYGLGQERAALPGSDPAEGEMMQAFASNADAVSPEAFAALMQKVNPDGSLPPSVANATAIQQMYSHYASQGDMESAEEAAASVLQATRDRSMKLGALAGAALESGDYAGAAKALIAAYNQVPDNREVEGQVDESGNGRAIVKDARSGEVVQEMPINPEMMKVAAQRFMTGSDFYPHLARMAPSARPTEPSRGVQAFYEGGLAEDRDEYSLQDEEDARMEALASEPEAAPALPQARSYSEVDDPRALRIQPGRPPEPPEPIDTRGMSRDQYRTAKAIDAARARAYREESTRYDRVMEARRAAAVRDVGENNRAIFNARKQQELEETRQRAEERRAQRSRQNGLADEDVAEGIRPYAQRAVAAKAVERDVALSPKQMQTYRMPGQEEEESGIPTMQMPAGVGKPRTEAEVRRAMSQDFRDAAFYTPQDRARVLSANKLRTNAVGDYESTAADYAARVNKRDRSDLSELNDFFDPNNANGLFSKQEGKTRVAIGNQLTQQTRDAIENWSYRLAYANPDMPPKIAARSVMDLLDVRTDADGRPIETPNYRIRIDDRGMGRVELGNGKIALNLDKETLRQIAFARQERIDAIYKNLGKKYAPNAKEEERARLEAQLKANMDAAQERRSSTANRLRQGTNNVAPLSNEEMRGIRDPRLIQRNRLMQDRERFYEEYGIPNPRAAE